MHMADALLSPAVGGVMWAAAAGSIAYCSSRVKQQLDDRKVPLMGVLGAFLFAAQMINFTIPATGSSGHLGGGLLLAVLLGPHAAFLTIASVLMIQALFFADGGLLALGCNMVNLGIFPAFVAYPLVYRPLAGRSGSTAQRAGAAIAAAIVGLQLGAFAVVLETALSGIAALPFTAFVALMQPIHLGIGIIEGVATALIIGFVQKARPDIFASGDQVRHGFLKSLVPAFLALALVTGGFLSWFASAKPDGLEWSIEKITGTEEQAAGQHGRHARLAALQEKLSFLPGYNLRKPADQTSSAGTVAAGNRLGTSLAGVVGALLTLGLAGLISVALRKRQQLAARKPHRHEHSHPHLHDHEHPHRHGELEHSHPHSHAHSHPHPHVHDHSQPHAADPNPRHSHEAEVAAHSHDHDDREHGSHDHEHT